MEEAAERVTFATAFSVTFFTAPKSLSVRVFPPKTNAKTTSKRMIVRGMAKTGDANHKRTSSSAATPSTT